jgi:uncharacterized membrane protein (UPF0127 family)
VIKNLTQKTILAKEFSLKKGFDKITGLLGENEARTIVFKTRFGIHTFFLKSSIDLLILDDKGVAKVAKSVKPNRIALWNIRYKTVIELPYKTLRRTHTKIDDLIAL